MTCDEFNALMSDYGWSIMGVARLLGFKHQSVSAWANGNAAVPQQVASALLDIAAIVQRVRDGRPEYR